MAVLRKRWLAGDLSARRFSAAVDELADLWLDPTSPFMRRAWQLRASITPNDAVYVALAETLDCDHVTADRVCIGRTAPAVRCGS